MQSSMGIKIGEYPFVYFHKIGFCFPQLKKNLRKLKFSKLHNFKKKIQILHGNFELMLIEICNRLPQSLNPSYYMFK